MPATNSKKTKKEDMILGTKRVTSKKKKTPLVFDFSNPIQMAELLGLNPTYFDGSTKNPKFTKSDFLSAAQIARALNIDKQIVESEMLKLYKRSTPFKFNQNFLPLISKENNVHHSTSARIRLHPMGMPIFMELLGKKIIQQINLTNTPTNQGR